MLIVPFMVSNLAPQNTLLGWRAVWLTTAGVLAVANLMFCMFFLHFFVIIYFNSFKMKSNICIYALKMIILQVLCAQLIRLHGRQTSFQEKPLGLEWLLEHQNLK